MADLQEEAANLTVRAPFAGKLQEVKEFHIDDEVSKSAPVATLVNDKKLKLSLYFSYAYEKEIHTGQSVQVSIPAVMGSFEGRVEKINKVSYISPEGAVHFEAVIVFDALAAAEPERLCTTVQLTDAGLAPGSGLGNHRAAFCEESLGRPVLAVGAPTLMRAERLAGRELPGISGLIVTPRDIDLRVREIARAVGYGVSLALHPGLTVSDVAGFLA